MSSKHLRADLQTALQNLATGDLRTSATGLLGTLGYASNKTLLTTISWLDYKWQMRSHQVCSSR